MSIPPLEDSDKDKSKKDWAREIADEKKKQEEKERLQLADLIPSISKGNPGSKDDFFAKKWFKLTPDADISDKFGNLTINSEFTAPDGEIFVRENPDSDIWFSKTNVVQSKGVKIETEDCGLKTIITDVETGNKVQRVGSVETTTYPSVNDNLPAGKVVRQVNGTTEWLALHDSSGTLRSMQIENNKLVNYTDASGNTYSRTDRVTAAVPGDEYSGGLPLFTRTDSQGRTFGQFTVTADRSGNVCVRDESIDSDGNNRHSSAAYARRERIDGTIITSDFDNTRRQVTTADGMTIVTERKMSAEDENKKELATKTIKYADGSEVRLQYEGGKIESVGGYINDENRRIDYRRSKLYSDYFINQEDQTLSTAITEKNGAIEIKQAGSSDIVLIEKGKLTINQESKIALVADPEQSPAMIQKTPAHVDVEANIEIARQHRLKYLQPWTLYPDAAYLKQQSSYNQPWDFKSPAKDELTMSEYEAYGNWHAGVVGNAAEYDLEDLQEEGGALQIKRGTSKPEWGDPGYGFSGFYRGGTYPYGDDPKDARQIEQGYKWYEEKKLKRIA